MINVCFTGHKPNKLFGYDITNQAYLPIRANIRAKLLELLQKDAEMTAISGCALGIDTIAIEVCEELIQQGYNIKILLACPCKNQGKLWSTKDKLKLDNFIAKYPHIFISDEYTMTCMQERNIYMVNNSDVVIAVWDGTNGGTANCVRYVQKKGKPIVRINPKDTYTKV